MIKRGVSAIIMADNGSNYFLILHRNGNWKGWEFPKGKIEEGENSEEALIREVMEETSLKKIEIKKRFDFKREFKNEDVSYIFDVYLIEANMNHQVKINRDVHDNFLWAPPQRILELLEWEDEKETLQKVLKG